MTGSRAAELRITRVFPCVAHGFKARLSFKFSGRSWRRSLAVDGSSGTSRGHPSRPGPSIGTGRDLPRRSGLEGRFAQRVSLPVCG
jgi:hypothetical protein